MSDGTPDLPTLLLAVDEGDARAWLQMSPLTGPVVTVTLDNPYEARGWRAESFVMTDRLDAHPDRDSVLYEALPCLVTNRK